MSKAKPEKPVETPSGSSGDSMDVHAFPGTRAPTAEQRHADRTSVVRAAGLVSFMTIASRILGLWRDRVMANLFGATWINDAFQIAFLLPNMTRRLFGEGALSSAFVPVFSAKLAVGQKDSAFRTASILLTRLAVGLFVACAALVLLSLGARYLLTMPAVMEYAARHDWGTPEKLEKLELTLRLAEVMLGYCILINVAAVLMGVLNSLGHFATPAAAPVLLNVCMIAACYFGHYGLGQEPPRLIMLVALSVMAGGLLQLLIMVPPALARGFRYRASLDKSDEGYREVMTGFLPVILGVAVFQINLLLDQVIARALIPGDGPVTMLAYGNRLVQLPWALFSLSFATAALPLLSKYWAEGREEDFAHATGDAVRHTLFLALPSAAGLCLLSRELVRLFYGTGAFLAGDGEPVIRTGRVVFFFSLGLVFYSLNSVLARAIYATKDTRTPTRSAIISVGVNLALNLILVLATPLREAGLALASAISGAVQTWILCRALVARLPQSKTKRLGGFLAHLLGGAVLGGIGAYAAQALVTSTWKEAEGFLVYIAAALGAVLPFWWVGRRFFLGQLEPVRPREELDWEEHRYGVPEDRWARDLTFYHGVYTMILATLVMGLMVYTVRDSLPPGEGAFGLIFQRALVPVGAGMLIFAMAAGSFGSREYEELKAALLRRGKQSKD
jgi:putative peptidoglycan lipid II flippase